MDYVWKCMAVDDCPIYSVPMCGKEVHLEGIWAVAPVLQKNTGTGRTRLGCPQERVWVYNYWEYNFRAR